MDWFALPKTKVIEDFAEYISPGKVKSYKLLGAEIVPARREGVRLWDRDGKCYINCRSSGGVFNLGHTPPEIKAVLLKNALFYYNAKCHAIKKGPT